MRNRQVIETESKPYEQLTLEVLLDIRDLLTPKEMKVEAVAKVAAQPKKRIKHRKKKE